jgi:hypothetical protein
MAINPQIYKKKGESGYLELTVGGSHAGRSVFERASDDTALPPYSYFKQGGYQWELCYLLYMWEGIHQAEYTS